MKEIGSGRHDGVREMDRQKEGGGEKEERERAMKRNIEMEWKRMRRWEGEERQKEAK